ncbi:MAG: hypothetical protein ACYSUS_04355 [Planctomycetota bacterium]|jgi:hypothetical protein
MKKIQTNSFIVSVPEKYKIKKRNPYLLNKLFFLFFPFRLVWSELTGFIKQNSPDLKPMKGFRAYEVLMEGHKFTFFTEMTDKEPSELSDLIQSQTRHEATLEDFEINGIIGKKYGSYSDEMTWIDWWLKKEDCLICLNIQGLGMPPEEIQQDVSRILNSLEFCK